MKWCPCLVDSTLYANVKCPIHDKKGDELNEK